MIAKITPRKLNGTIKCIGSKSYAHRALICAGLLSNIPVEIEGITPSKDIDATLNCLRALGVEIAQGDVYRVISTRKLPNCATLDCIESGSTLRFFLPIACALGVSATFVGAKRLFERPNDKLIELLKSKGVEIENYKTSGRINCGEYVIDASISSQYVSGLLFALCMLDGDSRIRLVGECVSKQYIDITLDVLRYFGMCIDVLDDGYLVHGGIVKLNKENGGVANHQNGNEGGVVSLQNGIDDVENIKNINSSIDDNHCQNGDCFRYHVEGDWSNSAFALVGGAIGGDVTLCGLNTKSSQGDMRIVDILKESGANIVIGQNFVRVSKGDLKAFSVDAEQIPDMVPALCVLASYAKGTTEIYGVERLKIKESNRLDGVMDMMTRARIENCYRDGVLYIVGGQPHGATYQARNDHRMAMSQTIMALYANGQSQICGAECVVKSYPQFFEDIRKLGGGDCVLVERE